MQVSPLYTPGSSVQVPWIPYTRLVSHVCTCDLILDSPLVGELIINQVFINSILSIDSLVRGFLQSYEF